MPQAKTGEPLQGLTVEELDRWTAGLDAFNLVFNEEDGLGPVFNKDSCGGCHSSGGAGGAGGITVTRFGFISKAGFDPLDQFGGSLRQSEAISDECAELLPVEANVQSERLTNALFGAGLVEGIADEDIEDHEAPDTETISGRVHWVPMLEDLDGDLRAGRFGWKAQLATILSFAADASLQEMGITNRILDTEVAPNGDADTLADCDTVPDPEDDPLDDETDFIDLVTDFQIMLAAPPQTPKSGMTGEQVFIDTGCADCHLSTTFTTGTNDIAALSEVVIKPYSDFLLHDMGTLGDSIEQGDAGLFEMRTPSLWGLRWRVAMLHDGTANAGTFAERVDQAILAHDGEGLDAAEAYADLTETEVDQLVAFLDSLGRGEFDHNGDNLIDEFDLPFFLDCLGTDGITPDDECAISDIDQDGDVDADDFASFMLVYTGENPDCNDNGIGDLEEIVLGSGTDCNGNGVLDECDITAGDAADVNGNLLPDSCELFIRGDSDIDGAVGLTDALHTLEVLFQGNGVLECLAAADANASGSPDIADAVYTLTYTFLAGDAPSAPFPDCGVSLAPGPPSCDNFSFCE